MSLGLVILAHGSRDPVWLHNVHALAQALRAQAPGLPLRCAYLELCAPDLQEAAAQLLAEGVTTLRILPLFFGMGQHARQDIPKRVKGLQQRHPQLTVHLLPAAGDDPGVHAAIVKLALERLP